MKTTLNKLSETKFEVTCEIDSKDWKESLEKSRKKAYSEVEIKGFRKGHVPEEMAKKYINEGEVMHHAIDAIIPEAFEKAMIEHKLRPFIQPKVNVDKVTADDLTVKFTVVTVPTVELGNYKNIKIEKKTVNVTDEDINNAINSLLNNNAELIVKETEAAMGDTVIFDFEGFVDGKPFEGGKSENYELELGSKKFIPGFEEGLVGVKPNTDKDVEVTFPEDYVENLKGKKAIFKCKIHEVKEKKIPALTDETVKGLEIAKVETVAQLKEYEREQLTKQKTNDAENAFYNDLVTKITDDSKVNVDDEVIEAETQSGLENMKKQVESNGFTWDQYLQITKQKIEDITKKIKVDANKNIRQMLVINQIAMNEKITVTDDDIKTEYQRIADLYKMDVKKVEEILGKQSDEMRHQLLNVKVRNTLLNFNK